ncbi:hypothetical protein F441_06605 [Phytophthora nicotianae CJ01A1]|uniref:Pseudouridine synthase RsuA/RluA-like domain-containing protein n=6 Tax=Phytophthora nicotianae TaxID=4792 RepID=W2RC27_PHYN3|nr:hypothetical protein PPTG_02697 [Phytophthora nicotianae INRA-310]ETI49603.1 hypothetical protein F443_06595 [Phytophthora nicotianae P1569]ETK89492.1 hypothetical protein L915_06468 [Phytophthora nicotianae]ETO78319.1 hypothetical protein F444_06667 [Phytophthora nicotianae P1976]ETP19363.1 hypothetical protein F441_06605 [Phytophthora nicotianae CJ01A1]ETP47307.1 hypothetical protein F442_06639 [Phytophthora nicotianae P10297]
MEREDNSVPAHAQPNASILATESVVKEGEAMSKRQLKKLRRADRDPAERQAKKRKSKRDAKNAKRFQAEEPKYSFANGYRMVEPYVYEFRTYAKARWFGRELLEIFTKEFGANSPEYYKFAIASGRISVNLKIVPADTIIKNGDLIIHTAHRHEPPVSGEDVSVVYEDDDLIVVSKPPSMPTHPCGAYRHNSLHTILQATRPDLPQLNIVHRLDRLTSGVVLLAKNAAKAKALSSIIADRQASKTYLARVRGQFPDGLNAEAQDELVNLAKEKCPASVITFPEEGAILISCPLRCLSARDGVWECHEEGKPSETLVRLVRTDKSTSLMKCKPVTGRTHQIRLHLQLIGFPIANDPCYGGELHFGESAERAQEIAAAKRSKADLPPKDPVDFSTPRKKNESEEEFMKRTCTWCYVGEAEAFNETQLHCSKIWLHALEYKLDGQMFKVPEPSWAAPSAEY